MTVQAPQSLVEAVPVAVAALAKRTHEVDDRMSRCRNDVNEFAKHVWITDPVLGEMAFEPWSWQPGLLDLWAHERLVCVLKARQLGVSWLIAIYVLWVAMFRPSQRILLVSTGGRESSKLLEKVSFILRKLPDWLRPPHNLVRENTSLVRFMAIDSEIESLPSSGTVGRSRSASLVVLDEHAHQQNAEDIFVAIEPTVQRGQLISVSTANGLGALHTRLYKDAAEGSNGFLPVFIAWDAHPDRDKEWQAAERARLSASAQPQLFEQEYPSNDVEAFVQSGSPVFTDDEVQRQPIERIEPVEPGLWVYREPVEGGRYVIGADPAGGIVGGDWCSGAVSRIWTDEDGYHGEQVAQLRGFWPPEQFAERLHSLALRYSVGYQERKAVTCVMGVERNNHGHAVLLRLRQLNPKDKPYSLTYWKKGLGWITDSKTRPLMYDEFAGAIRQGQVEIHDPITQSQMSTFASGPNGGEAQQGYHDDDMTSNAIAWQHHRRAFGVILDVSHKNRGNGSGNGKVAVK